MGKKGRQGSKATARRGVSWLPYSLTGVGLILAAVAVWLFTGGASPVRPRIVEAKVVSAHLAGAFRVPTITGGTLAIPTGKPTLLYFMSSSCSSCWQGESQLSQVWPKLRNKAEFISLDVAPGVDTIQSIQTMQHETGATWPQAFASSAVIEHYRVEYLDTAVVLSPSGRVLYEGEVPPPGRLLSLLTPAAGVRQHPPAVTQPPAQKKTGPGCC